MSTPQLNTCTTTTLLTMSDGSSMELSGSVKKFEYNLNNNLMLDLSCDRYATFKMEMEPGFMVKIFPKPTRWKRFKNFVKRHQYATT